MSRFRVFFGVAIFGMAIAALAKPSSEHCGAVGVFELLIAAFLLSNIGGVD